MSAYEVALRRTDADPLSLRARRLGWWRKMAIAVSFTHMMTTIALFSSREWYAGLVAAAMTLLIDLAIFELIEYQLEARRTDWQPSGWIGAFLVLAIVLSIALNAGYLWAYRPAGWSEWLTIPITAALAVFVPGWIAIAAVMSAELHARQSAAAQAAQQRTDALAASEQARAAAEQRAAESEQARQLAEQSRTLAEQETARLRTLAEQSRTLAEQRAAEAEQFRTVAEQSAQDAGHWRTVAEQERTRAEQSEALSFERLLLPDAPPDEAVLSVAGKSYSVRAVAEAFEVAPSTAAARLAKARAKE